ncbi:MAG: hypothetical protein M5U34_48225 [Chloroflexi bacterium]|nr:hypothetical protein [Chloroflexota bacterium]
MPCLGLRRLALGLLRRQLFVTGGQAAALLGDGQIVGVFLPLEGVELVGFDLPVAQVGFRLLVGGKGGGDGFGLV